MAKAKKNIPKLDKGTTAFKAGCDQVATHPLLRGLYRLVIIHWSDPTTVPMPAQAWAILSLSNTLNPVIHANKRRLARSDEWAYIIAHHLLHLGFEHHLGPGGEAWNTACDLIVAKFLSALRFGLAAPPDIAVPKDLPAVTERSLYNRFLVDGGIPHELRSCGLAAGQPDMHGRWTDSDDKEHKEHREKFMEAFGAGLADAVGDALKHAAGRGPGRKGSHATQDQPKTEAIKAREWFMASFPLLGALAARFRLEETPRICQQHRIFVAAVDAQQQVIYINKAANLSPMELRFVIGHELLHVGLRHAERAAGRDPYLWNAACDYVINQWLRDMGVGTMPKIGVLFDPELQGMSAEQIYDRIVRDSRRIRKLATLRGIGLGDMLEPSDAKFWDSAEGLRLDEFYRNSLTQGLEYHLSARAGRGLLPEGLLEEIRSLSLPPIPWDVRLGNWFDEHFPPVEKRRSYARPSRRQGATPDVPRPSLSLPESLRQGRTFGVIIDTSGSMPSALLGYALGAIASYSAAKDVALVRLVYCDALAYDQGYVEPEALAGSVLIQGRGGTILQRGVDVLEYSDDFPKSAPILVITDGFIESDLNLVREHAFLVPAGARLPFVTKGPVFYIKED